jgi:hypothetical protein
MGVISNPSNYLITGAQASGNGSAIDTRAAGMQYIHYATYAASALYTLQASFDLTAWMPVAVYTATTATGTATGNQYYPYVRAQINSIFSAASPTGTGSGILFYGTMA